MKSKLNVLIGCLLILMFTSFVVNKDHLIEWKDNLKLSWNDYQLVDQKSNQRKALAMTATNIEYTIYEQKNVAPRFVIKNYFNKEYSWTRTKRSDILQHEQLHFDISELYTRKMRRDLGSMTKKNIKDVNLYLKKFEELNQDMIKNQRRYDKETHFKIGDGENLSPIQQFWIDSIHVELNKLESYRYN